MASVLQNGPGVVGAVRAEVAPAGRRSRAALWVEVLGIFGLLMLHIWVLRGDVPGLPAVLLGLIGASWVARRDTMESLGLQPASYRAAPAVGGWLLAGLALIVVLAAFENPGVARILDSPATQAKRVMQYFGWALFQQLILHGYFTNRLHQATGRPWASALAAATLFGVVHLPNLAVTVASFAGGGVSALIFLNSRNLYLLAAAHAILAVAMRHVLGVSMRVGPGYLE